MKFPKMSEEQAASILDACYEKALHGAPGAKSCSQLAEEYLAKYPNPVMAIDEFVKWQVGKCTTSGFFTSLGGISTLPITLPANLTTVWYVQLRMIGTIAAISGYNPSDDEVQSLAYICLAGGSVSKICREAGVQFTNKLTASMLKKNPRSRLYKNQPKSWFSVCYKSRFKRDCQHGKARASCRRNRWRRN
jgi:hypothetical protein